MSSFGNRESETLLTTTSGSATGVNHAPPPDTFYQTSIAGTGAVSGTMLIEGTNTPDVAASWILLQTHTLSGTTTDVTGAPSTAKVAAVRARSTAISGTGATMTTTMAKG